MNWRFIKVVWHKEIIDSLRDRRTIISMLVIPLVVMPALMFGVALMANRIIAQARAEAPKVMIVGGQDSPNIVAELKQLKNIQVVPFAEDYTNYISEKRIRLAIQIPPGFDAALAEGKTNSIRLLIYEGEIKSTLAAETVQRYLSKKHDQIIAERLRARNIPPDLLRPFDVALTNVAPPQKVTGNMLGSVLPYLVIILCMTGAMYPAMDLTAGEKERGTMETILCSPVARQDLVFGKFLTVLSASLTTALLALLSMGGTFLVAKQALLHSSGPARSLPLAIDVQSLFAVFVMVVPIAIMLSAAQMALALFAKSFKEAQSYLTPLTLVVMIPAVFGMLPGMDLNYRLALVPILNTSLACKEILTGNYQWAFIALIFGSSCLYAGLALWGAVQMFKRESVIFRA